MFDRIDHIGIAVQDMTSALELWEAAFGLQASHREQVEQFGVDAALLDIGENHIELMSPLGPETPIGKFLAKRGAGLHHVAYQVRDIDAALSQLKSAGLELLDEQPRVGIRNSRVAFVNPRSTGKVLVEIVQPAEH